MKKLFKGVTTVLMIGIVLCGILCAPTIYRGHQLYKEAVETAPINVKVAEIRNSPGYTPLDDISDYFLKQIIKNEDKRFRYHPGFDILAIARAAKNDILAGGFVEGGSTITQQLAKNMYFDFGKVMERKVAEIFVAVQLERKYTKDEILEMYVNCINYGEGCIGIRDAAEYYYGEMPEALTEKEADALVYAIKCPNLYNPVALAKAN